MQQGIPTATVDGDGRGAEGTLSIEGFTNGQQIMWIPTGGPVGNRSRGDTADHWAGLYTLTVRVRLGTIRQVSDSSENR